MAPIRLRNNTSYTEKNLCFVNSSLQLLNSIEEFREIFTSGSYQQYAIGNTPIWNEMSRLFKFSGSSSASASALRILVASKSEQPSLCDGSQQDIVEFIEILLRELEKELSPVMGLLSKFWGKEVHKKRFLEAKDGSCHKCGQYPMSSEQSFCSMKLYVKEGQRRISLQNLVMQNQLDQKHCLEMRCSYCNDGIKVAANEIEVIEYPDNLLITLMKFPRFNEKKLGTIVEPDSLLTLSNGNNLPY